MKKRKRYPTDLTDKQWEQFRPLLPQKRTPPEKAREYIDASLYVLRTGGAWRMLPHDFPAWESGYTYFRKLERDGSWQRINDALREKVRVKAGREVPARVIIVDSQSVKTTEKGGREATTEANGGRVASARLSSTAWVCGCGCGCIQPTGKIAEERLGCWRSCRQRC